MTVVNSKQVIFVQEPKGVPVPERDMKLASTEIDIDSVPLNGGALLKLVALSLDPTLRNSMRTSTAKPYAPLYQPGKPMWGFAVSEVVRVDDAASDKIKQTYKPGDLVYSHLTKMEEYQVAPKESLTGGYDGFAKITRHPDLNITQYVGAAGMPGMTAWMSVKEIIGDFKPNSTIFVNSAAGAVGQIVCQLAKQGGARVLASAGSEEKVRFLLDHCGADAAFNYKTSDPYAELSSFSSKFAGGAGIDYCFDNVGGAQLDAYIANAALYGTVVVCGAISAYNADSAGSSSSPYGASVASVPNFPMGVLSRQLTIRGFLVSTFMPKWLPTFLKDMPQLLAERKIKAKEDIRYGIDSVQESMADLLEGRHDGKVVVLIDTDKKDKWIVRTNDTFTG